MAKKKQLVVATRQRATSPQKFRRFSSQLIMQPAVIDSTKPMRKPGSATDIEQTYRGRPFNWHGVALQLVELVSRHGLRRLGLEALDEYLAHPPRTPSCGLGRPRNLVLRQPFPVALAHRLEHLNEPLRGLITITATRSPPGHRRRVHNHQRGPLGIQFGVAPLPYRGGYWRAMSEGHVELFRRGVEAQNRRDARAVLDVLHPDVEWHPGLSAELAGEAIVYRGHAAVRGWLEELWETFLETDLDLPDVRDLGESVIGIGRMRTRGQASGIEWETPIAYVADFDQGKVTRLRTYLDTHAALKAVGLQE